jgi:hypothetical protein
MNSIAQPVNTRSKPTTRIRQQLTAGKLDNGEAAISRNGQEIGRMFRTRSAHGLCYVIQLGDVQVSASGDIEHALRNAAVHIWRAETAAPGGGSCSI